MSNPLLSGDRRGLGPRTIASNGKGHSRARDRGGDDQRHDDAQNLHGLHLAKAAEPTKQQSRAPAARREPGHRSELAPQGPGYRTQAAALEDENQKLRASVKEWKDFVASVKRTLLRFVPDEWETISKWIDHDWAKNPDNPNREAPTSNFRP